MLLALDVGNPNTKMGLYRQYENPASTFTRGIHPDQLSADKRITSHVSLKSGNLLVTASVG